MPIRIASHPAARWLVIAVLVALVAGLYFREDQDACWEQTQEYVEAMHEVDHQFRFFNIVDDRAARWFVGHPQRACPRVEDIATARELVEHNVATIDFVCSDHRPSGRRVVAMTAKPLVNWPRLSGL